MLYKDELKVNQKAQLKVMDGLYTGIYVSRVEDIGEDYIKLAMPIVKGEIIPLSIGTKVEVVVSDQDKAYGFTGLIRNRQISPVPMFTMKFPDKIRKIQRRNYVRIECSIPVQYAVIDNSEELDQDLVFQTGRTLDISGGGLRLFTNHSLEQEQKLFIKLKLLKDDEIEIKGKVIRLLDIDEETKKKRFIYGIEFIDINERDRDKIISFIFEKQRQLRRKGLI